jgi:hypothetical protein
LQCENENQQVPGCVHGISDLRLGVVSVANTGAFQIRNGINGGGPYPNLSALCLNVRNNDCSDRENKLRFQCMPAPELGNMARGSSGVTGSFKV